MEEQIEILREELNRLTEDNACLYSDQILKLSQELDKLIYEYCQSIAKERLSIKC